MIKVNEYFDGNVKSMAFENKSGVYTVGVIAPGNYEFETSKIEVMTVISGEITVQLPESSDWKSYKPTGSFTVDKNKTFKVKIEEPTSYLCLYK